MQLLSVNYHYIRDKQYQQGIYPISIAALKKQIDELAKYYIFISSDELADKIKNRSYDNKKYCLLTFDDGLKEQMEAFNVLKSMGIPAIFYIPTAAMENNLVLDVHKLHFVRTILEDVQFDKILQTNSQYNSYQFDDHAIANQYQYETNQYSRKIKFFFNFILDRNEMSEVISLLFNEVVTDEKSFSKQLYMDTSDIQTLNRYQCLGTHSSRHFPLASVAKAAIKSDIQESIDFLHKLCKADLYLNSISYPYGKQNAVDNKVIQVAEEFDFSYGFTMFRGINTVDNLKKPLLLKRIDTNDAPGGKLNSTEYCL